ncbi:hypothetical protein RND81_05G225700 [Saponaria officinalis]|uniref:Bifunctional inhibitor/plant lipid transfer protein/seed storage helical domain-containing protein n=1 Tax=Saponaria officinalis TaxID=3572 RepID=A0AAW1KV96_SAPOF
MENKMSMIIMVLAVSVLIFMPITPSSAQDCTATETAINDGCSIVETEEQVQKCCGEINTAIATAIPCLCEVIAAHLIQDPLLDVQSYFDACTIDTSYQALCFDALAPAPSPSEA